MLLSQQATHPPGLLRGLGALQPLHLVARCITLRQYSLQHPRPHLLHRLVRKERPDAFCSLSPVCCGRLQQKRLNADAHRELDAAVRWLAALLLSIALVVVASRSNAAEQDQDDTALTIRFKGSLVPEIRRAQQDLAEAWGYVNLQFVDPSFDRRSWSKQLQGVLDESFSAHTQAEVYKIGDRMLEKLGDPFTRILPPEQATAFQSATNGELTSLGFQVAEDQESHARIAFVVDGGPAAREGLAVGDRLLFLNGSPVDFKKKPQVAEQLRKPADITFCHVTPPAAESASTGDSCEEQTVHLNPEPISIHPVQYAVLDSDAGKKLGYVRMLLFTLNAPQDISNALQTFQKEGVQGLILDLRDNFGGAVASGYEVASSLLPQGKTFFIVVDRSGVEEIVPVLPGLQPPDLPLAVLVNGGSASTSEAVAAALRDSGGAVLVGEPTFGKAKMQRAVPLHGGATLLLSNTVFLSPKHAVIDKVGLQPDKACRPEQVEVSYWASGQQDNSLVQDDPCVDMAKEALLQR